MDDPAATLYERLKQWSHFEEMIQGGEAEGLHLECRSPLEPRLTREHKQRLAKAVSGFGNTAGGVILWGVSTAKHQHSGLDVLTQIEPLANCHRFAQEVAAAVPQLTTPAITDSQTKTVHQHPSDKKGVVITYIPKWNGDPLQSTLDNMFYFRSGDDFVVAPYEMIKRLFSATESPDLHAVLNKQLVKVEPSGVWNIPILLENNSSAVARDVFVSVIVENPQACENISPLTFRDVSHVNPGRRMFAVEIGRPIHRALSSVVGSLNFKMRIQKRAARVLRLGVTIYADKMRARTASFTIQLAKTGFSVKTVKQEFLF